MRSPRSGPLMPYLVEENALGIRADPIDEQMAEHFWLIVRKPQHAHEWRPFPDHPESDFLCEN